MKKNVLITGAHGFIGKNLAEYLSPFYQLHTPPHKELDLLDEEKVRDFILNNKINIIIHCANVGGGRDTINLTDVVHTNLRMFFNVVRNSNYVEKIIHFSSGAEYDKSRPLVKVKEDNFDKRVPKDDYGFYKYVCSKHIEKVDKILCLRLFGVYGKYENYRYKFISNAILKNLLKLPIVINQNVYFDYLYIDDLLKIVHFFLANRSQYKIYNVCCGKSIDLITIAKIINKISDFKSKITVKIKGLNNEYTGSNARLKKEIPNLKFTPYQTGIRKLFRYYLKQLKEIDPEEIKKDRFIKYCTTKQS